jgi:hypothetical protein
MRPTLFPICSFDEIDAGCGNSLLSEWKHKMGPLKRPFPCKYFALFHHGKPVAVVAHGGLIATHVGGGLSFLTRENTIELARLCAARSGLCRVALRMWREFVFPELRRAHAISYQDATLHNGNTYRFDGWQRAGFSSSGADRRSGTRGRRKWIWVYPAIPQSEEAGS